MKRSVDAARISRARCAQHWPVLDVHSLSLSHFAVAQWRLEPNGLIGEERDHNADRLLSLSLSLCSGESGDTLNFQHHGQRHNVPSLCISAVSGPCPNKAERGV